MKKLAVAYRLRAGAWKNVTQFTFSGLAAPPADGKANLQAPIMFADNFVPAGAWLQVDVEDQGCLLG